MNDILFHICACLDDETMIKFAEGTRLWQEMKHILEQSLFWKKRTEFIAGRTLTSYSDTDWKRAYYVVKEIPQWRYTCDEDPAHCYVQHPCVGDLPLLRVVLEVVQPRKRTAKELRWEGQTRLSYVSDVHIINYLLENKYIEYDTDIAQDHLARIESLELAELLVKFIPETPEEGVYISLITNKRAPIFDLLFKKYGLPNGIDAKTFLQIIADGPSKNKEEVLKVFFSHFECDLASTKIELDNDKKSEVSDKRE